MEEAQIRPSRSLGPASRPTVALLAAAFLASLLAASARAGGAPGDTAGRARMAPLDSAGRADSVVRVRSKLQGLSRILAHADSVVRARGGARADDAQLFLSWNAPWGLRRAQRERMPACADSTREDTLYMCVRTGRASDEFTSFTATLVVHATGADSLGDWWKMRSKGGVNPGSLRVEWAAQNDWSGAPQPFRVTGQGFTTLENGPYAARLRMIYAVPLPDAAPISADAFYALARVILQHRPDRKLAGCDRPVVIEWAEATLGFGPRDEPRVSRGERVVSFAGPYSLTEPFHGARTEAWKPGRLAPPGK